MFVESLAMRLRGAYLTFHRLANSHFEQAGMTADQFVLLRILAEEPGLTQREVVDRACSDPNTIGAILKRLEAKGLIRRKHHPSDGRAWCVFLTAAGKKLQRQLDVQSRAMHGELTCLFSSSELQQLQRLLARIPPAMAAARTGASEDAA